MHWRRVCTAAIVIRVPDTPDTLWRRSLPYVQAVVWISLCTLLLWKFTLWNGYPTLWDWDSSSYIRLGHGDNTYDAPFRPVLYGWLLVLTAAGQSLLWSSLVQAWCCAYIILAFIRTVTERHSVTLNLCLFALLGFATRLPALASLIYPDVLTGLIFLAQYVFAFSPRTWIRWLMLLALCLIVPTHISFGATALASAICLSRLARLQWKRVLALALSPIIATALIAAFSPHAPTDPRPAPHYFVLGRMAETGLLQPYLDRWCETESYLLCPHRERLRTIDVTTFVWHGNPWKPTSDGTAQRDLGRLLRDMSMRDPWRILRYGVANTVAFARAWIWAEPAIPHEIITPEQRAISQYYPGDVRRLSASRQYQGRDDLDRALEPVIIVEQGLKLSVVLLTLLILMLTALRLLVIPDRSRSALIGMLCFVAINGIVCANGSGVFSRYFDRIDWLPILVFAACLPDLLTTLRAHGIRLSPQGKIT